MQIFYLTLTSIFASAFLLCSCGNRNSAEKAIPIVAATDSLPADITDIVAAVKKGDSVGFSSRVNYPLERPYPLKDIQDEKEMKEYYSVMVDDSLKNVIAASKGTDWTEEGWRGWTVKDGKYLWIDGDIYEVNYLSAREKNMKDSLVRREKASLPAQLAKGWVPQWVMEDVAEGTVYRIDADSLTLLSSSGTAELSDGGDFRLAVYKKGADLRKNPERIIRGRRKVEGSVGSVSYVFDSNSGRQLTDSAEYVIELYSETGGPRLHHREKKSETKRPLKGNSQKIKNATDTVVDHDLKKVYWLDKVKLVENDSIKKNTSTVKKRDEA